MGAGSRWGDLEFFFQIFSRKSTPGARVTAFKFCQHFANTEKGISSKRHENRPRNIKVIRRTKNEHHLAPREKYPRGAAYGVPSLVALCEHCTKQKFKATRKSAEKHRSYLTDKN